MTLDDLKSSLSSYRTSLANKRAERQGYTDKADEIRTVYNELLAEKRVIKGYKAQVKEFYGETYADFKGNIFENTYKPQVENLLGNYDTVIDNIDTDLDNLNDEVTRYENLALQCDGPIGYLASMVNSLVGKIQNWVN